MKADVTIKYYESFIPARCRKPRYNEVTDVVKANLREVSMADVQLAFTIDYADKYDIYANKCKLYKKARFTANDKERFSDALQMALWYAKNGSQFYANSKIYNYSDKSTYESKEDIIRRIKEYFSAYLVIDGVLYESCHYPIYQVCTFDLGANHGGTALMPRLVELPKTEVKWYTKFSPYDFESAKECAVKIATDRLDTESIRFFKQSITCHIPELSKKY